MSQSAVIRRQCTHARGRSSWTDPQRLVIKRSRSLLGAGEDHCRNSPAHTVHDNNQFHTTFGHSPPLSFFSGCNGTKILKGPPLPPLRRPSASGAVQDFMNPPKLDRLSTVPDGGPSLARGTLSPKNNCTLLSLSDFRSFRALENDFIFFYTLHYRVFNVLATFSLGLVVILVCIKVFYDCTAEIRFGWPSHGPFSPTPFPFSLSPLLARLRNWSRHSCVCVYSHNYIY